MLPAPLLYRSSKVGQKGTASSDVQTAVLVQKEMMAAKCIFVGRCVSHLICVCAVDRDDRYQSRDS